MARSRLVKISIENSQKQWYAAISNVKRPRISKILTNIIEVTSYDGPTVSRTLVFAILTFRRRNCQTLAHVRLELKKTQMSSWDGSILFNIRSCLILLTLTHHLLLYFHGFVKIFVCMLRGVKLISPTDLSMSEMSFKCLFTNIFAKWGCCGGLFLKWTPG